MPKKAPKKSLTRKPVKRAAKNPAHSRPDTVIEALEEDLTIFEAMASDIKKLVPPKPPKQQHLRHRTNTGFFVVIAGLIILLILLIALHTERVKYFEEQYDLLAQELIERTAERDEYVAAYEIVLEDARAFGELYESGYVPPIEDAKISSVDRQNVLLLSDAEAWNFYNERGLFAEGCIETTKLIRTPDDVVEIVVIGSGTADIRLIIDAQEVDRFPITGIEDMASVAVSLPKGTHYIDLVLLEGSVTFDVFRVGDRTLDTSISLLDHGQGFAAFDCQDTVTGNALTAEGALRLRIEKI